MASVQTSSYQGRYLKLTVVEESTNIANNTSTLRWTLESIGGSVNYYSIYGCKAVVNGNIVHNSGNTSWNSYNFPAATGSTTGTITVGHNNDGTASAVPFSLTGSVYNNNPQTYSGSCSLSTIPRQATMTSATNFNDESNPSFTFTNPANASMSCWLEPNPNGDHLATRNLSGSSGTYTWSLTEDERNQLRSKCTSSNSCTCRIGLYSTIGGTTYASYKDMTMTIVNGNPTFATSNVSYKDTNDTIVAITGNNQHIVRSLSNLKVTVTSATAKKSASISKYDITFNNVTKSITSAGTVDFGTINLSSNANVSVKVTDSRGNTTTVSKTITILDWVLPSAVISLKRVNNYEDETKLKVQVTISSVNSKNSIQRIRAYHKLSTDASYNSYNDLTNDTEIQLTLNKLYAYDFRIEIKDKFGTKTYNLQLAKGIPIMFIDIGLLSVGINCFPATSNSLEVSGYNFNNIHPVGAVMPTLSNTNPSNLGVNGTWELLTSQSVGGTTVYYWKRTA